MQLVRAVAAMINVRHAVLALGISALAISQSATGVAQSPRGPEGGPNSDRDYKHDTSPPLREIPPKPYVGKKEHEANRNPRAINQHKDQPDPVVETTLADPAMPSPLLNFNGIPFPGVNCNCAPPDTNGEVGLTQYVQIANEGLQVFNKTTGASALGPIGISTLWSGFGGVCETSGSGDPVLIYDQLADRWVVSQFAGVSVPTDECIAVSTTSDATGSYFRYAFHLGSNFFDYPKLAVWPDAYYMAMNVFSSSGQSYLGPQPFAFNRARMLAGLTATFVTTGITGGGNEETYLPADLDGKTLPPAGAPNTFVEWPSGNQYKVFHFHADFTTPANSTFTLFATPPAAGFTVLCATTRSCVPQAGTTSQLDAIADRLMFRAAYRNFGSYESLVTNYTVSSGGVAGVRWIELRNVTNGPVTVFQQSTYQPDTTWRWMGSAAMDGIGNLAVGYSASSTSMFPQIRYAGRLASDPLNTLAQGEATLFSGTGSQTGTSSRWGDYSALTVDPVDDCTFWYTTEYYQTTGSFNWRTRIGTFKFPTCGGSSGAALSVNKTADAATVSSGTQIGYRVTLANSGGTSATGVTFTDTLPAGTGINWSIADSSSGWSIGGAPPNETLIAPTTVAAGATTYAHIVSATTAGQTCSTYNNTASFGSTNGGSGSSGQVSITVTCGPPPSVPPIPANFNATPGPGKKKISLSWTTSTGATSYKVYRRNNTQGGTFAYLATVTSTSYQNTGLTSGVSYTYYVTAVNAAGGESAGSSQKTATVP